MRIQPCSKTAAINYNPYYVRDSGILPRELDEFLKNYPDEDNEFEQAVLIEQTGSPWWTENKSDAWQVYCVLWTSYLKDEY